MNVTEISKKAADRLLGATMTKSALGMDFLNNTKSWLGKATGADSKAGIGAPTAATAPTLPKTPNSKLPAADLRQQPIHDERVFRKEPPTYKDQSKVSLAKSEKDLNKELRLGQSAMAKL